MKDLLISNSSITRNEIWKITWSYTILFGKFIKYGKGNPWAFLSASRFSLGSYDNVLHPKIMDNSLPFDIWDELLAAFWTFLDNPASCLILNTIWNSSYKVPVTAPACTVRSYNNIIHQVNLQRISIMLLQEISILPQGRLKNWLYNVNHLLLIIQKITACQTNNNWDQQNK